MSRKVVDSETALSCIARGTFDEAPVSLPWPGVLCHQNVGIGAEVVDTSASSHLTELAQVCPTDAGWERPSEVGLGLHPGRWTMPAT